MSDGDFEKFLEGLDATKTEPEKVAEPEALVVSDDPYARFIGHGGPIQEQSPFDAFIEAVAAEAEATLPEEEPQYEAHDWKIIRDAIYEEDYYVWRCRRCCRQVNVDRSETLTQALAKYNIHENCSLQTIEEVHTS